jgi:hypothetical protein
MFRSAQHDSALYEMKADFSPMQQFGIYDSDARSLASAEGSGAQFVFRLS